MSLSYCSTNYLFLSFISYIRASSLFIAINVLHIRILQMEYDLLKQSHNCYANPSTVSAAIDYDGTSNPALGHESIELEGSRDVEMLAEAKLLRQHKGRLESRMHVLEEHNQQLEWQLTRLRQLLDQVIWIYYHLSVIFLIKS